MGDEHFRFWILDLRWGMWDMGCEMWDLGYNLT